MRFAGPVRTTVAYRADDVFVCALGHRRLAPSCSCGFYAVERAEDLRASVVTTAVLDVALTGRVVRHAMCVRGERQWVRRVTFDGWCSFCVAPADALAGILPAWHQLPHPWRRAVPVCAAHRRLYPLVVELDAVGRATGAEVSLDHSRESRAARSLRRQYGAVAHLH